MTQGKTFIENMKSRQATLLETAIKRSIDTRAKSKIKEASFEGIMQYARVPTVGGKH